MTERGIAALRGVLSSAVGAKVMTAGDAEELLRRVLSPPAGEVTARRISAALHDVQRLVPLDAGELRAELRRALATIEREGDGHGRG